MKFWNNLRMSDKLVIAFMSTGMLVVLLTGLGAYFLSRQALEARIFDQMESIRENKTTSLNDLFERAFDDGLVLASSKVSQDLTKRLEEYMEEQFISTSGAFDRQNSGYNTLYNRFIDSYKVYVQMYGYHDVLVVNSHGQVVFSVLKEEDLGQNLKTGVLSGSGLANVWRKVAATGAISLEDFSLYQISGNPFAFVGAPILRSGELVGTVVLKIPASKVDQVLEARRGLGETGQVLAIGSDFLMRSNSNRVSEPTFLRQEIRNDYVVNALAKQEATARGLDHMGTAVLVSHGPFSFAGLNWALLAMVEQDEAFASLYRIRRFLVAITLAMVGLLLVLALGYSRAISRPLRDLREVIMRLGEGQLPPKSELATRDEIGEMSKAINVLIENLHNTREFALEVGQGKFDTKVNVFNDKGDLGEALASMRDSLLEVSQQQARLRDQETRRNWATQGIALFSDILRQNNNDTEELAAKVVSNLVKYIGAVQGGLFVLRQGERDQRQYLELMATYAFNRRKFIDKTIELGEGLVGACAIEKQTIHMTKVPDHYLEIASGFGKTKPESLLIVPLKLEDKLFGILELASLKPLDSHKIEFVEKVSENIASTLATSAMNRRTQQLLEASRQQQEELHSREEELRQNMEEMQATQEEALRRSHEMHDRIELLEHENEQLRAELEGLEATQRPT